jgi:predicted kinase
MALAARTGALRFSVDEWMASLFWADAPPQPTFVWALERAERCEKQMWAVAEPLLARGVDVVFDVNPAQREHRDQMRFRALQLGAEPKLHYLDVDREARRERVRRRNEARTGTYVFWVTDEMFDYMDNSFEPPSDDELYNAMIVCESPEEGAATLW